jgi:hypothetical protein
MATAKARFADSVKNCWRLASYPRIDRRYPYPKPEATTADVRKVIVTVVEN